MWRLWHRPGESTDRPLNTSSNIDRKWSLWLMQLYFDDVQRNRLFIITYVAKGLGGKQHRQRPRTLPALLTYGNL